MWLSFFPITYLKSGLFNESFDLIRYMFCIQFTQNSLQFGKKYFGFEIIIFVSNFDFDQNDFSFSFVIVEMVMVLLLLFVSQFMNSRNGLNDTQTTKTMNGLNSFIAEYLYHVS